MTTADTAITVLADMDAKTKSTADLTTLPAERAVGDAVRALADEHGYKLIRFVGALANGWRLLTAEQQRMAMSGDFGNAAAQPTTGQQDSGQPAVDSVRTDQSPAEQGSDMQSEDPASTVKPTAGPEPRSDANPAGARRQAS